MKSYKIRIPSSWAHDGDNSKNFEYLGKSYKYLSREWIHSFVQKKSFCLGYGWGKNKEVHMDYCEFLFFGKRGLIYHIFDLFLGIEKESDFLELKDFEEITWQDFLKLPEQI
jgi:hypothetical protein